MPEPGKGVGLKLILSFETGEVVDKKSYGLVPSWVQSAKKTLGFLYRPNLSSSSKAAIRKTVRRRKILLR